MTNDKNSNSKQYNETINCLVDYILNLPIDIVRDCKRKTNMSIRQAYDCMQGVQDSGIDPRQLFELAQYLDVLPVRFGEVWLCSEFGVEVEACDSLDKILHWINHLSREPWVDCDIVRRFINSATLYHNIKYHSSLAGNEMGRSDG